MQHKAYKFRIFPTKEQAILIAKTIGCSRFVFNHFLAKWNSAYQEIGKGLTYNSCSAELPALKSDFVWLKEVEQKLAKAQKVLSRRQQLAIARNCPLYEAKNYQKQKKKVACMHEKITNTHADYLHKISSEIIKNHDVIGIEDLQVAK